MKNEMSFGLSAEKRAALAHASDAVSNETPRDIINAETGDGGGDDMPDTRERMPTGDEIAEALDHLATIAESLSTLADVAAFLLASAQAGNQPAPPASHGPVTKRRG